jgi:peroxiredoxin
MAERSAEVVPVVRSSVGVGDTIPSLSLPDESGTLVSLPRSKATLLVFFRGQW